MFQDQALEWIKTFGPIVLIGLMILNRIGVPTVATLILIAAGSLARTGVSNVWLSVCCAYAGLIAGDSCGYILGRYSVTRMVGRIERQRFVQTAHQLFDQYGMRVVFLSRFLLLPFTVAVNLLAASLRVPFPRFMIMSCAGNLLFILLYFGFGYLFGGSWDILWRLAVALVTREWWLLVLVLLGSCVVILWRRGAHMHGRSANEANASD